MIKFIARKVIDNNIFSQHLAIQMNDKMIKLKCDNSHHPNSIVSVSNVTLPKFLLESVCCDNFKKKLIIFFAEL